MGPTLTVGARSIEPSEKHMFRFWSRVSIGDECWNWCGGYDGEGYGRVKILGVDVGCHRLVWATEYGDPGDMLVWHKCENRSCVRSSHLFLSTKIQNAVATRPIRVPWDVARGTIKVGSREVFPTERNVSSFWARVSKTETCWNWEGTKNRDGYGNVSLSKVSVSCHRFGWYLEHGDPGELSVCHHCDNPACVRASHMFLGTQLDNMRDASSKGRLANRGNSRKDDAA